VFFTSADTGFAGGSNGLILKTTDGGSTWSPKPTGFQQTIYDIFFPSPAVGFGAGESGTILKTTNSGETWSAVASGLLPSELLTVFFTDANTGYTAGGSVNNIIYKTIDGGTHWTPISTPPFNYAFSIVFPSQDTGYLAGWGSILQTTDAGATWTWMDGHIPGVYYSADFPDASHGYFCGEGGAIVKYSTGGPVGIKTNTDRFPRIKIYPNATQDQFTLETSDNQEKTEMEIFDAKGRSLIRMPITGKKMQVDVSPFAPGIYFVHVSIGDGGETLRLIKK
jgi:photosystem II stability/assembly factor-like uncharacterized protein